MKEGNNTYWGGAPPQPQTAGWNWGYGGASVGGGVGASVGGGGVSVVDGINASG